MQLGALRSSTSSSLALVRRGRRWKAREPAPRPARALGRQQAGSHVLRAKAVFFLARLRKEDMEALRDLVEGGKLRSVVDSTYPLERVADVLEDLGNGHPQGKIVVTV